MPFEAALDVRGAISKSYTRTTRVARAKTGHGVPFHNRYHPSRSFTLLSQGPGFHTPWPIPFSQPWFLMRSATAGALKNFPRPVPGLPRGQTDKRQNFSNPAVLQVLFGPFGCGLEKTVRVGKPERRRWPGPSKKRRTR